MNDSKSTAQSDKVIRSGSRRLREFDPKSFSWEERKIFFDAYVAGEKITDETEKRDLLITSMADQPFKRLVAICKPEKPTNCSYDELLGKLRSNYARVTYVATEQIKFFSKRQTASQTITDFANDLRDKATACGFPAVYYEQALITAFVGGLNNDQVRKHLMQRHLKTFEETLNSARTTESVLIEGENPITTWWIPSSGGGNLLTTSQCVSRHPNVENY